jgi:DNA-binding protein HU-beta
MTKTELVKVIAEEAKISRASALKVLDSFTGSVAKVLRRKNGKVVLIGFGTFTKIRRKARNGRNPQTGKTMKIKAKNAVKFKAGKKLKEAVE